MPRRGENIYKRKDGRWEGRYIALYDLNNKAKYASVYAHSYKEVKQKLIAAKNLSQKGKSLNANNSFTVAECALEWLKQIRNQTKYSTFVKYSNILNNHIIPSIGANKIENVTENTINRFISLKLEQGNIRTQRALSPKSVKDILSVVKLIFNFAQANNIPVNCNFRCIKIKQTGRFTKEIDYDMQIRLTHYLLNYPNCVNAGILLCLYTGLRLGEVCALKFEDISLSNKTICVTKTMQRIQNLSDTSPAKTSVIITEPKSNSSIRVIPLPDFLAVFLSKLPYTDSSYILTGREDKFMEPRTLENRFKRCLKECNLEEVSFHKLRHRFATYCVEIGFDVKSLSEILGHSGVNITLNRYVHSSFELKRTNMKKLDLMLNL